MLRRRFGLYLLVEAKAALTPRPLPRSARAREPSPNLRLLRQPQECLRSKCAERSPFSLKLTAVPLCGRPGSMHL